MKLEEKISIEGALYIHSMDFNFKEKQFTLNLVKNPRSFNKMDRKLTFTNVSSFHMNEETNRSVDQIRGVNEFKKDGLMNYEFLTEQRTIRFWTDKEPLLTDLP